jgi:CheY-like chemotaxis protein
MQESQAMKNILIIDDNDLVCRLIEKLAKQKNIVILVARNGEDAKNMLMGGGLTLDIIFLDLNLPYINGWDLLTVIKNDPVTKDTPVVILTGLTLSPEEIEKLQGKVSAIIDKKTFNKEAFAKLLKKLL